MRRWQLALLKKTGISPIDLWLAGITIYSCFQGISTIVNVAKAISQARMEQTYAAINLMLFVISVFVIYGATGLIKRKRWAMLITKYAYMTIIPLIAVIIEINWGFSMPFTLMRCFDIAVAFLILFLLTNRKVSKRFA